MKPDALVVSILGGNEPQGAVVAVHGRSLVVMVPGGRARYYRRSSGEGYGGAHGTRLDPSDVSRARYALGVPR